MNEQRRKYLLIGLLGIVAFYFIGESIFKKYVTQPANREEKRALALKEKSNKVKLAKFSALKRLERAPLYRDRSLPSKSEFAVSAYHDWLLQLAQKNGLNRTNLNSNQPTVVKNLYRRIVFTLRGTGELDQVTRFMHAFYETGLLHKIRSVSLNPLASGRFDMTLTIEALSLLSATSEQELPKPKADRLAGESFDFYRTIYKRDIFQSSGSHWAKVTKLSAITRSADGRMEAWFESGDANSTVIVRENETSTVGGHDLQISKLDNGMATVVVDGDEFEIALGQTLAECFAKR